MTSLKRRALLGASAFVFAALSATSASAQNIDRIVAFGDSLADTGNALQLLLSNPALPPATRAQLQGLYPTGRFSGGTSYIDSLSQILDAPVLNYAVGGAQTGSLNQFTGLPGFTQQTAIFLSGATPPGTIFPSNSGFQEGDLLTLSIGINDARAFFQANPGATTAQAQAAAATSVINATNNLNLLVSAGAPTISYVALNAGLTPDVLASPTLQALGNAFSTTFNTGFQNTLAGHAANGVMVHYLDGPTVLANISANPAAYGISNIFCPAAPNTTCIVNASGFLFYADGIHPTSDGMRIIAQYVAAQLKAPLTLQAPGDVSLDLAGQFGRTLTGRVDLSSPRFGATAEGLAAFIVGDTLSRRVDAGSRNDEFKIEGLGVTVGVEYGFGNGVAGIAANLSRPNADFTTGAADVDSDALQIGAYAGMGFGAAFAQGYVGYGRDDYEITRRGVVEAMEADTEGHHWIAGAKAGYLLPMGNVRVGPVVALDYAKAKVDGYTESGDPALTLNVSSTSVDSLRGGIGAEVRADLEGGGVRLRPYGAAMLEKELSDGDRSISFAQTSAPGIVNSFAFEGLSKKAYGRFTVGATAAILSGVLLDASLATTAGKEQGDESSARLGVKLAF